jgi:alkylhydroperoxidase family enzyme
MLDFAVKVAKESQSINDSDFKILESFGFDIEDAWRIASVASFFAMSNRLANTFSMLPNEEFYNMGR